MIIGHTRWYLQADLMVVFNQLTSNVERRPRWCRKGPSFWSDKGHKTEHMMDMCRKEPLFCSELGLKRTCLLIGPPLFVPHTLSHFTVSSSICSWLNKLTSAKWHLCSSLQTALNLQIKTTCKSYSLFCILDDKAKNRATTAPYLLQLFSYQSIISSIKIWSYWPLLINPLWKTMVHSILLSTKG